MPGAMGDHSAAAKLKAAVEGKETVQQLKHDEDVEGADPQPTADADKKKRRRKKKKHADGDQEVEGCYLFLQICADV